GATGVGSELAGVQVQLQDPAVISVAAGTNVLFDTTVSNQSTAISYDPLTGALAITESGIYYIAWWVAADGIQGGTAIVPTFAITSSAGDNIQASSPIISGQLSGNALLAITAAPGSPVTLQLINATDSLIGYGMTPVKADLTIISQTPI
ncbi:hypothetical protein SAMN04488502_1211, partial [Dendrosporobacter quercicolus]